MERRVVGDTYRNLDIVLLVPRPIRPACDDFLY
jgi:hypothetical protein